MKATHLPLGTRGGGATIPCCQPLIRIAIGQDITQLQDISANALNDIGFVGLKPELDPKQLAAASVSL